MGQDAQDELKKPEEQEKWAQDPETSWRGAELGHERGKTGKKQQSLRWGGLVVQQEGQEERKV